MENKILSLKSLRACACEEDICLRQCVLNLCLFVYMSMFVCSHATLLSRALTALFLWSSSSACTYTNVNPDTDTVIYIIIHTYTVIHSYTQLYIVMRSYTPL